MSTKIHAVANQLLQEEERGDAKDKNAKTCPSAMIVEDAVHKKDQKLFCADTLLANKD